MAACSTQRPLAFRHSFERMETLVDAVVQHTKLKAAQTACEMLAKDLLLLLMGVRTAVLVDYLPPKLVPAKLQECLRNLSKASPEFDALQVCCLSQGNYLIVNLALFAARLRASVDHKLADIELVDCSSRLSDPVNLGAEAKAALLPAFSAVYRKIDEYMAKKSPSAPSSETKPILNLKGDTCGAPLPTLAGWVLEYPIVYFVDDPLSGNCLPEQELLLFRFELPQRSPAGAPASSEQRGGRNVSAAADATSADGSDGGREGGAVWGKVGKLVEGHHVLSFTVPEELYGEAGQRAVEGLKTRIGQRVVGGGGGGAGADNGKSMSGEEMGADRANDEQLFAVLNDVEGDDNTTLSRKREREEEQGRGEGGEGKEAWRRTFLPSATIRNISCHVVAL